MKKMLIAAVFSIMSCAAIAAPVGIASGAPTGTNYPIAENIKNVCSTNDAPITNVTTAGSGENIDKIYSDKTVQYGIVQEDALVYQRGIDADMMKRVVMVFPFFDTEIHLVANPKSGIKNLNDLNGKRVVEGPNGSATWITVQVIKQVTKITWNSQILSQSEGLKSVLAGKADAMFVVAGKPVGMFEEQKAGLVMVPVEHPALDSVPYYKKTMLSSDLYPFSKVNVNTYKAKTVLATYAFKNQYQKEIGDLVTCITRKLPQLRNEGHPKWKSVDPLDIERVNWPAHPAAVNAIKREAKNYR